MTNQKRRTHFIEMTTIFSFIFNNSKYNDYYKQIDINLEI